MMQITLTKTIRLHSAFVFLRLKKMEERKDIKDYLDGVKTFDNPIINNRIKDYLKNLGIYDEQNQLTETGRKVKESGKIPVKEEGKYQIWYSQGDPYWGNKIFFFRRVRPQENQDRRKDMEELPLSFATDEDHFLLKTKENGFTTFRLLSLEYGYAGESTNMLDELSFKWHWQELQSSSYTFEGTIEGHQKKEGIGIIAQAIPSDENLHRRIMDLLPDWKGIEKRYRIRFDGVKDEESRKTFEYRSYTSRWKDFGVQIRNLPLMPYDKENAATWRNWLLNRELEKDYFNPDDFEELVKELNAENALKSFGLDTPQAKDFIPKAASKKVFWHLNAPMDLNPNLKIHLKTGLKPVELKRGEQISFAQIASKLGIGRTGSDSVFVYYDRYVANERQQKAVSALSKSVHCSKRIVITNLRNNSSDFIQKNAPQITLMDCKSISKEKPPHDRYLIISDKNGKIVWNISNSTDFIVFSGTNIDETTIGTIEQSVVFTPIGEDMLDKYLLNFIENQTPNGN